jgi:arylsulfatase A-like enzyme
MIKNVLLLTIDSLRLDCYDRGSIPGTTAEETVVFDRAFATGPGTTPSFPALLTGTLPLSYGGLGPLHTTRPRVADRLRKAGLGTGGFQSNPFLSRHFEYDVGFDRFEDYQNPLMGVATKVFPRGIEINNPKLARLDESLHLTDGIKKAYQLLAGKPRPYVSAEVITDDTVEWLDRTDEPFFCWAHYMDVHHPCYPPERYRDRFGVNGVSQSAVSAWYSALLRDPASLSAAEVETLRRLYDAAIAYTDDQIERIVAHLQKTGRYEDTLIVLTSDHGELFGEHGEYGKPERMYDELLHVPLVVTNGPNYLASATDELVSLLDVPPLIHDAFDIAVPEEYEGRRPGINPPREYVLAEHEVEGDAIVGARSTEWLYEGDELRDEHRLFDCRNEGFERVLIEDHPEASALREAVLDRLRSLNVESPRLEAQVEGDVQDRLEDLGYL